MKDIIILSAQYLLMVIPVITVSVFIMNLLRNSGMVEKISWISRPLTRFGHMKEPVGITFLTSFGSPTAANGMLKGLFDNSVITKNELVLAVLVNAFPIMVMESRTMLPIMLSLIGKTGILMFSILLGLRFIQTMIILMTGRIIFEKHNSYHDEIKTGSEPLSGAALVNKSLTETVPTIRRVLLITAPITVVTFLLVKSGFFENLAREIQFLTSFFPIPAEGLGIVAAYFGHYVAGYTMAGTMLTNGAMSVKDVILTLLAAKIISSLFFTIRHSTPYYIGIFGSRLGTQIMLASVSLRNVINITAVFVLYFVW